ncbi:EAL domain-containing protein [Lamprobacter modestohalophilus]|uniref:EAL domain-containing protein n=1 Tax=Lamprobacter modestohalophilus TaxID=1064514 RepID=UPI002ADEF186|nr:EAL domain-containing protein [Lamprobacter modestohalophilus]MEA1051526.1 EAL domain-containing protein [Lamprobacter modestohalophilus]
MQRPRSLRSQTWFVVDGLHDQFSLSVNISPRQFADPDFLDKVEQALTSHAVPAQHLKLELTESSLFHDMDHAIEILEQLRKQGIGIEAVF